MATILRCVTVIRTLSSTREPLFRRIPQWGEASVSVYILVCDINDNCVTGDANRMVTVYER